MLQSVQKKQKTSWIRGVLKVVAGVTRKPELRFQRLLYLKKLFLSLLKIIAAKVVDATGNDPAQPNSQFWFVHHAPRPFTTLTRLSTYPYRKRSKKKIAFRHILTQHQFM